MSTDNTSAVGGYVASPDVPENSVYIEVSQGFRSFTKIGPEFYTFSAICARNDLPAAGKVPSEQLRFLIPAGGEFQKVPSKRI